MKCKICGHRTTTLNAMRIHYVKKHPGAMKRKKSRPRVSGPHPREPLRTASGAEYCRYCGARL